MARQIIYTEDGPRSLAGYSQAVEAGGLIFVSGMGPFDPKTGDVVGTTNQEQTAQCLRNIDAVLRAAGSSLDKAVNATWLLVDGNYFAGMNEEWGKWFPKDPPSRQGGQLPIHPKGMKISIALVAEA